MIISPRRWGKTSLVEKVSRQIANKNSKIKVVNLDLFATSSQREFLEVFASEIVKASSNKLDDWIHSAKDLLKSITPSISLGVEPMTDFSLQFNWNHPAKNIKEILDLPQKLAEEKNIQFVICIDEFQNLASFDNFEQFEKKMRSAWQRQSNVTYCLYGSMRHMMLDIFDNSSRPFYRFGDIILLPKISTKKWVDFIVKGFANTKKEITPELAQSIAEAMDNHPWYVQQLSHYTWLNTSRKATYRNLEEAIDELLTTNSPYYLLETSSISRTQLNLLKAIANNEQQLTSKSTMELYELGSPNNVTKNRNVLMEKDLIHQSENEYIFLDPAFELWFRREFA
jgi:AAA+ ATPase superfamily predicted ATPase